MKDFMENTRGQPFSQEIVLDWALKMLKPIVYMNKLGLIHGDLSMEKYVMNPKTGQIKLTDYRAAHTVSEF